MRKPNWLPILREVIKFHENEPFEYGKNDCVLFAARCVDAMTGSNWLVFVRETAGCRDEATSKSFIESEGSIEDGITRRFGDPVLPLAARRGDLCLINTPWGPGLGICIGTEVLAPGENGLVKTPLSSALKAWRVD